MVEEFRTEESKAPFNMALSTLEAIRKILCHIEEVSISTNIQDDIKQKMKINLVKRFYVDSAPLLDEKTVEKYKDILKLKPKTLKIISEGKLTKYEKVIYDFDLEIKLDNYLIELQIELQRKNYYMPPRRDLGSAVGSFG